jgi:copper chaperone
MKSTFKVEGMSCQHCVMAVKKEIQKLDVKFLDVIIGEVIVEFDESYLTDDKIRDAITEAGYKVVS